VQTNGGGRGEKGGSNAKVWPKRRKVGAREKKRKGGGGAGSKGKDGERAGATRGIAKGQKSFILSEGGKVKGGQNKVGRNKGCRSS